MRNRGVEIGLRSVNVARDNLTWTTNIAWSLNRNTILSLPGGDPIFSGEAEGYPTHETRVGQPIGMFIGYLVDGIYQSWEDIERLPSFDGAVPGNLIWRDVNGDGEIHPGPPELGGDFGVIGNPHPKFTFGINNQLSMGRFDFSVHASGRVGGDVDRREYWRTLRNIDGIFVISQDYYENFWRSEDEPGDGLTPTPLGGGEARRRYRGQHELSIHDGTNLWVRNVTLRYNPPIGFGGFRTSAVYVSLQNPMVFTRYPGNPEVQRNAGQGGAFGALLPGVDWIPYPVARHFTVGLELGL
jgi:TonB-dependent starch-binding outer membrane protein SusC